MWQKFMYDGPKYMLGIRIPVRQDLDLFGHIRILERAVAGRSQLDSELQQNLSDQRILIYI
jgi:hypothetical protein